MCTCIINTYHNIIYYIFNLTPQLDEQINDDNKISYQEFLPKTNNNSEEIFTVNPCYITNKRMKI